METSVIKITICTAQLNNAFRKGLVAILTKHPGKTPVSLLLSDGRTGIEVLFLSKKYSVCITPELFSDLKSLDIDAQEFPANSIN